jgi:hypothetical protein
MKYAALTLPVASMDTEKQKESEQQHKTIARLLNDGYQIQISHMIALPDGILLYVYLTKAANS